MPGLASALARGFTRGVGRGLGRSAGRLLRAAGRASRGFARSAGSAARRGGRYTVTAARLGKEFAARYLPTVARKAKELPSFMANRRPGERWGVKGALRFAFLPKVPGLARPAGASANPFRKVVNRPFDRTRQLLSLAAGVPGVIDLGQAALALPATLAHSVMLLPNSIARELGWAGVDPVQNDDDFKLVRDSAPYAVQTIWESLRPQGRDLRNLSSYERGWRAWSRFNTDFSRRNLWNSLRGLAQSRTNYLNSGKKLSSRIFGQFNEWRTPARATGAIIRHLIQRPYSAEEERVHLREAAKRHLAPLFQRKPGETPVEYSLRVSEILRGIESHPSVLFFRNTVGKKLDQYHKRLEQDTPEYPNRLERSALWYRLGDAYRAQKESNPGFIKTVIDPKLRSYADATSQILLNLRDGKYGTRPTPLGKRYIERTVSGLKKDPSNMRAVMADLITAPAVAARQRRINEDYYIFHLLGEDAVKKGPNIANKWVSKIPAKYWPTYHVAQAFARTPTDRPWISPLIYKLGVLLSLLPPAAQQKAIQGDWRGALRMLPELQRQRVLQYLHREK